MSYTTLNYLTIHFSYADHEFVCLQRGLLHEPHEKYTFYVFFFMLAVHLLNKHMLKHIEIQPKNSWKITSNLIVRNVQELLPTIEFFQMNRNNVEDDNLT